MKADYQKLGLLDLGAYKEKNVGNFEIARVITEHKGLYRVKTLGNEYPAKVTGKQMFEAVSRADYPVVGDFILIEIIDNDQAVIREMLPRRSVIAKKEGRTKQVIAANVDIAFIVESVDRDYSINRLERYSALCLQEKIKPVIVLNKADLISNEELTTKLLQIEERLGDFEVILTSVSDDSGLDKLTEFIKEGLTCCFLGSSGVGKSSIINKLVGKEILKTGEIGKGTNRGKHTTTHREMFFLKNGGILIDNPGMREVGLADSEEGVQEVFDDIATLANKCRFSNCTHTNEPGCAVLESLSAGKVDQEQYENYLKLKKEVDFYEMSEQEKRDKDRRFGKYIKNSLKKFDKYQ